MKVLLEVFRNTPMGRNCRALSQNVAQVVASNLDKDIEVRFLPLESPEAEKRGVELAPCLVVNGRLIHEGVPSPQEITALIEKALPIHLGVLLTRGPLRGEGAEHALGLALEALGRGDQADLFLLSDGVWLAKKGQENGLAPKLEEFLKRGGEVLVSGEHLEAAGLSPERLFPGVRVLPDPYDRLVDLAMEAWDKVVVL